MLKHIRVLYFHRDLLWMWTYREIQVRYKQSVMGGLWAILQPLSLMVVFTVVFSLLVKIPSDGVPYPVFAYSALLPWTFLATSIAFAVPSLVNNMNLVSKIYFPREVLPIASVCTAFVDFAIGSVVFLGMMLIYQIPATWAMLWVPVLVLVQMVLMLGLVLLMSAVNVFYRDIRFIIPLLTQIWMYASPVIYPTSMVPPQLLPIYMLNPMAGLIDSYRRVLLQGQPPMPAFLGVSAAISLILFFIGYRYFKRSESTFADLI